MPFVEYDEVEAICSDCGRIFRSEEALVAHRVDSHAGRVAPASKDPLTCPDCGRRMLSAAQLRAHREREHAGEGRTPSGR
ncbi:MAG TPA: C2H2-type zinc finger protein [Thermoplasmata archaeon]|nr:C2H2-type zinc finger protein [Thermoplasmata archaeon]